MRRAARLSLLVEALVNAVHRLCKAGVEGSIPFVSTTPLVSTTVGVFTTPGVRAAASTETPAGRRWRRP